MSKTVTYILLVLVVYLLIIFPKMIGKNNGGNTENEEAKEITIRAGYTG